MWSCFLWLDAVPGVFSWVGVLLPQRAYDHCNIVVPDGKPRRLGCHAHGQLLAKLGRPSGEGSKGSVEQHDPALT
jgi:hypothetical protein